jgi:hypothetical protein
MSPLKTYCVWWLWQYGQMSGTTSSANCSTSFMKHCQLYSIMLCHLDVLLCFIHLPRTFARVRVSDHDLLLAVNPIHVHQQPLQSEEDQNQTMAGQTPA